ncbi:MAG: VTT domain-containing protein [Acidimicrobiales bacterium]|nr:VTT domain-containing protein [Acidimicrobiales bacterium]
MRRRRLAGLVAAWLTIVIAWFAYRWSSGLGTTAAAQELVESIRGAWWSVPAFLLLSLARPFVLVPATLITVAAGLLYGPVAGVVIAAAGANGSALIGHAVGRSFIGDVERAGLVATWRGRLRRNSFEAVLLMRLIFLPYDLVNYAAGYLGVRRWSFLAATAIGSLPGTVSFVLLGASLSDLTTGVGGIDRTALVVSVVLILASIAASRLLRRRAPRAGSAAPPGTDPFITPNQTYHLDR